MSQDNDSILNSFAYFASTVQMSFAARIVEQCRDMVEDKEMRDCVLGDNPGTERAVAAMKAMPIPEQLPSAAKQLRKVFAKAIEEFSTSDQDRVLQLLAREAFYKRQDVVNENTPSVVLN